MSLWEGGGAGLTTRGDDDDGAANMTTWEADHGSQRQDFRTLGRQRGLLELELGMVCRFAKRVPPSCTSFVGYRLYIVYRQVC